MSVLRIRDHTTGQFIEIDTIKGVQGVAGADGADGVTFTPSVDASGNISWTNDGGRQNPPTQNIKGVQGVAGADGADGVTFTPSVDASGNISWTNDGGRQNPPTQNIKGARGDSGVYVGAQEPTDPSVNVWLNPSGQTSSYATVGYVDDAVGNEETARQAADAGLQMQIDAITSQSDVVDVVGTYAELQAYTKPTYVDDIVKVLTDSTHSDAIAYYRCAAISGTAPGTPTSWTYIGSQGPFYTKSETDTLLNNKQATLVSGTNIKTVNGVSVLDSGNLTIREVPSCTASDNGKFLRVVNGAAAWQTVETMEGGSY